MARWSRFFNPFSGDLFGPSSFAGALGQRAVDELVLEPERRRAEDMLRDLDRQSAEAGTRRAEADQKVEEARLKKIEEEKRRRGRRSSILTSPSGLADDLGVVVRPQAQAVTLLGGTDR